MKNKIIILFGLIFIMLTAGCTKSEQKEETQISNIVFENNEAEQIVRNILNEQNESLNSKGLLRSINSTLKAFMSDNHFNCIDGVYKLASENPIALDENMLSTYLMVFRDKENVDLTVEDIKKCVELGNLEKKEEIQSYVDWYDNKGEYVINIMSAYIGSDTYIDSGEEPLYEKYGKTIFYDLNEKDKYEVYSLLKDKVPYPS